MKLKESSRAAQFYQQAADALQKVNPTGLLCAAASHSVQAGSNPVRAKTLMLFFCVGNAVDAIEYFRTAISMLCDAGRFSNAAKLQKQIAEIYESQDNKEDALESYRQASDYFSGENQSSSANNMLLKVAQFSAQLERYEDGYRSSGSKCHVFLTLSAAFCLLVHWFIGMMRRWRFTRTSQRLRWSPTCSSLMPRTIC